MAANKSKLDDGEKDKRDDSALSPAPQSAFAVTVTREKEETKVTIGENESTIDFDLNELKKLEMFRADKSIESDDNKMVAVAFEYSQPLAMTAFQLGVIERSCQPASGNPMEMFIPQLKAGITNRHN